jgi:hypothetical protein
MLKFSRIQIIGVRENRGLLASLPLDFIVASLFEIELTITNKACYNSLSGRYLCCD